MGRDLEHKFSNIHQRTGIERERERELGRSIALTSVLSICILLYSENGYGGLIENI